MALSGTITPGLPAGFSANDIHVCVVAAFNNTSLGFPAGWTKIVEVNNGANHRCTVAWRRAVGGDAGPAITGSGTSIIARIFGFAGVVTSGNPHDAVGSQANASSATITAPTITPLNDNDMVVFTGTSIAVGTVSGYSGTNPTFTEGFDSNYAGEDETICLAYGTQTPAGATGARTATCTAAGVNVGAMLSLTPAGGAITTEYVAPTREFTSSGGMIGRRYR